ncbi:MAG TPA: DUF2938 domain-containing protein [Ferrovibrio sp.]|jgi:hypothetical protein|uniref:DUF2938 domain-containing protein n=1 Tax=Ferrovibrio sp. TaxID=1917215 RepID=UPI002ED30F2C
MMEIAGLTVLIGAGATAAMDLWGLLVRRAYGVAGLDYRLVGRWLGHLLRGRLRHDSIAKSASVPAEAALGWVAHYAIGIGFATGLIAVRGEGWLRTPTIAPALLTGLVTLLAPFLVMQPAFGLGIAASRTPDPAAARLRSLITHLVFGAGLFVSARLLTALHV